MTHDEIKAALEDGTKTLCVRGIWYFTGRAMDCANEDCCSNWYENLDEAFHALMYFADNNPENVEEL